MKNLVIVRLFAISKMGLLKDCAYFYFSFLQFKWLKAMKEK